MVDHCDSVAHAAAPLPCTDLGIDRRSPGSEPSVACQGDAAPAASLCPLAPAHTAAPLPCTDLGIDRRSPGSQPSVARQRGAAAVTCGCLLALDHCPATIS